MEFYSVYTSKVMFLNVTLITLVSRFLSLINITVLTVSRYLSNYNFIAIFCGKNNKCYRHYENSYIKFL